MLSATGPWRDTTVAMPKSRPSGMACVMSAGTFVASSLPDVRPAAGLPTQDSQPPESPARRAVSQRMKKYWAERRKAKGK